MVSCLVKFNSSPQGDSLRLRAQLSLVAIALSFSFPEANARSIQAPRPAMPQKQATLWLEKFQAQSWHLPDYQADCQFTLRPWRQPAQQFKGLLRSRKFGNGWRTYLSFELPDGAKLEFITQQGSRPAVWRKVEFFAKTKRYTPETPHGVLKKTVRWKKIPEKDYLQPLHPKLPLSCWELLLPFVQWKQHKYTGSTKLSGQFVQSFELHPPAGSPKSWPAMRVFIDTQLKILLMARTLVAQPRSFQIKSFQKEGEHYFPKKIQLLETSKHRQSQLEFSNIRIQPQPAKYFDVNAETH